MADNMLSAPELVQAYDMSTLQLNVYLQKLNKFI